MNRRSFLSLTAAATAAATLPISSLLSGEEKKPQGREQFDDTCTAMYFLKLTQTPNSYKWIHRADWRAVPRSVLHSIIDQRACVYSFESRNKDLQLLQHTNSHVIIPWVEVWDNTQREVNLTKEKMLITLLEVAATCRFSYGSPIVMGEDPFVSVSQVECFRHHAACADQRLKDFGFPNQRQILVNSPGGEKNCDMIIEALDVIHNTSDSSTVIMGCEACPPDTMFFTAGKEHVGAFEQGSYIQDGRFISHVNMAILNDYAVTKIKF